MEAGYRQSEWAPPQPDYRRPHPHNPQGFLRAGYPSCRPTNSVKAPKASYYNDRRLMDNVCMARDSAMSVIVKVRDYVVTQVTDLTYALSLPVEHRPLISIHPALSCAAITIFLQLN